ncbi:SWIM zinc finger family protein [Nocardia jiangxiensis]|uniref:SWIM zinc finger family protein n=1 Tax=Nocardia jiangxiensis TaxID=282685 RepID=UPI00059550F3|nr:SWIM zinc finger family protein [Nocardia jiangxiensis]
MTWTAQQVAVLAPDAASLTAARKLHGRWNSAGWCDTALWGLCKGSGAKPYQTIVDLSGPAYKCSCPSRKFPCKHALSLLLIWSDGMVSEAAAPADYAAEWLAARAQREAKTAAAQQKTPSAATAAQRRDRVSAGLADLDVWLCDQVRTGLAQADRSFGAFESVAARMVDAQVPGVASALRQLPRNAVGREDWPAVLLREYARLHLLATAHRRLDDLEPALAASARTHIGYPVTAESVRSESAVRDHWMVLGLRITEEERVHTRKVWVRGRTSRRWALILDHSFGTPAFPADLPVPGSMVDADLHFYPGAAALRALWGERHGVPEPIPRPFATAPETPGAEPGGITDALTAHARALGTDPWLRSWPVLLSDVVPVVSGDAWSVVDQAGSALPLARLARQPWQLMSLSGGHPVTVVGEWTADGLVPVSAWAGGEMAAIDAEAIGGSRAQTDELASVALLGTARRGVDPAVLPEPVAEAAGRLPGDPAQILLEAAALQDVFARGAVLPGTGEPPQPAETDQRPILPAAAATRLVRLLSEGSPFRTEWFDVAEPHDFRAPDAICTLLLDQAKSRTPLRESLLRLAGERGRWLAEHHAPWHTLARARPDDQSVWSHGRPAERRAWLVQLRAHDPRAARETLTGTWRSEPGPVRADLLAVLAEGLTLADEPLLESALDDSRAEVRRVAADLLARLPDSAFAARMIERASRWLTFDGKQLVADLPHRLEDSARRDGIADRTAHTAYRLDGAPHVAAEWLRRVIAATPMRHWDALLGAPGSAARVGMRADLLGPVTAGWADAALAQHDSRWAATLFEVLTGTPTLGADPDVRRQLFALLPLDRRVEYLRTLDSSWLAEIELLVQAVPRPWPVPLAQYLIRLLLDRAKLAAARPGAPGLSPASYRTLFRTAAVHFPIEATAAVEIAARRCGDPYWETCFNELAHDLIQRTTMLEELQ